MLPLLLPTHASVHACVCVCVYVSMGGGQQRVFICATALLLYVCLCVGWTRTVVRERERESEQFMREEFREGVRETRSHFVHLKRALAFPRPSLSLLPSSSLIFPLSSRFLSHAHKHRTHADSRCRSPCHDFAFAFCRRCCCCRRASFANRSPSPNHLIHVCARGLNNGRRGAAESLFDDRIKALRSARPSPGAGSSGSGKRRREQGTRTGGGDEDEARTGRETLGRWAERICDRTEPFADLILASLLSCLCLLLLLSPTPSRSLIFPFACVHCCIRYCIQMFFRYSSCYFFLHFLSSAACLQIKHMQCTCSRSRLQ